MHKALVSAVSKPLDCLMNGHMSEATIGEAVVEDVDEATFIRFCHWAYSGYYYAATCSERPAGSVLTTAEGNKGRDL